MNYPVPKESEKFFFMSSKESENFEKQNKNFSRNQKNPFLDEYINYLNKFWWIYRSIPFVKNIYLCNSISFNALKQDSDIDLFIVCKSSRIWLCKFFASLLFFLSWTKKISKKTRKKFCLCFFSSEDSLNFYNISLKPYDIYFVYWLAHLAPLYEENPGESEKIFQENTWIKSCLSNLPLWVNIYLGNKKFVWNSGFKKFIEKIFWSKIWFVFEKIIKSVNLPIMLWKKKRLGNNWKNIIVSDHIMKFIWEDIRKKVNLLYKIKSNEKRNFKK